jgi:Double zinc ribbon
MAVIEFTRNYEDLSTDQGFQFKFYCDRCGNGYMSSFQTNPLGMAGGFLRAAGGLFGGMLGSAGNSAYEVQRAVGGPQHDGALQAAVAEIKPKFHQCRRCGTWVCGEICWNTDRGMCKQCAPDLAEELASAQAGIAKEQVYTRAQEVDQTHGIDVHGTAKASCAKCGAAASGGKFCGECGAPMGSPHCTTCNAELAANAKFCAECGTRTSA